MPSPYYTPEDFGAVGDGVANDTSALQSWLNAAGPGTKLVLPPKTYCFNTTLTLPSVNDGVIEGQNRYGSKLLYNGTSTTINLISGGSFSSTQWSGWSIQNFIVDSSTSMTAGNAIYLIKPLFFEIDVVLCGFYGPGGDGLRDKTGVKLWDGIQWDGFGYVSMRNVDIKTRNDGVKISSPTNGSAGWNAGFYINNGFKITTGRDGIIIGGGAGGVVLDECDVIACGRDNVSINNNLVAKGNNQIFFGQGISMDQAGRDGIRVNDTLGGYQDLQLVGTWSSSNLANGLNIICWGNNSGYLATCRVYGSRFTNNALSGIANADSNSITTIVGGTYDNNNYGISCSNGLSRIYQKFKIADTTSYGNRIANYSGIINGYPEVTYRRTRIVGTTATASPTVDNSVSVTSYFAGSDQFANRCVSASAFYISSGGYQVPLQLSPGGSVDNVQIKFRGSYETGRTIYVDVFYTADELLT